MARDYYVNGETMIYIKGAENANYNTVTELGLCDTPVRISVEYKHLDIKVNAFGDIAPEKQAMGAMARVSLSLVHFDYQVLNFLIKQSLGGGPNWGTLGHAGFLMGAKADRFGMNSRYVSLSIVSALTAGDPNVLTWTFYNAVLSGAPLEFPLGAERSLVTCTFDCVPYAKDPWNNGQGSYGTVIWDHAPLV